MEQRYDSLRTEDGIYKLWEESGFFHPETCIEKGVTKKDAEVFSIVLPPPNVTGTLHMGHAAMLIFEDIMIRYARMTGKRTLWLPGTDHAAIATQSKVESLIYKKERKTRHDLGREEFLKRVEKFAQESHDTIVNQVKKMGSSIDWEREAYTLDEKRELAVRTAFKRMYDAGLIYRGSRIVNWDPKLQTTVSDDEIEWVEEKTPFYYLKYGPFTIATARPETKFGDKYIVMHPKDKRYKEYKDGQKIELEWINGPVVATVVKDEVIDMSFGTGVMTITPWHDATDFDIAERHHLDKEQIIGYNGKLMPIAGEFAGTHIKKARLLIVEKLKSKGLLKKIDENYTHRVATNGRGGGMIEPQIKEQFFVAVNKEFAMPHSKIKGIKTGDKTTLKKIMKAAVKDKQIKIIPKRFEKVYFHWIDNLRDWCISRQIWFGHRIPVWYKDKEVFVDVNAPVGEWQQDPDTLDTWFSSGLWTFSTLGWPKETEDMKIYHPTSVLETGYDILFFWVARMILMTGFLLGDIPFHTVYLHGLVRDADGRKMSKTLDNVIDPLDMIQKYNADATRLSLVIGAAAGSDIKLSEDKVRGYRNFTTKIWNAARFVSMNAKPEFSKIKPRFTKKEEAYLKVAEKMKKQVANYIENYKFHRAAEVSYHFLWHTFADKIIEDMKPLLKGDDVEAAASAHHLLMQILRECLVMLHPFVPFVTETVYQEMFAKNGELLMVEPW